MSSYNLLISPIARDDLKDIYQFGNRNWGEAQSSKYLDALKLQFWTLTEQPRMGIKREEIFPKLCSFPFESHVIYYRLGVGQLEIIRVLHCRQDPHRHIK